MATRPNTKSPSTSKPDADTTAVSASPDTPPRVDYFAVGCMNSAETIEVFLARASGLRMTLVAALPRQGTGEATLIFSRPVSGDLSRGQLHDALRGF